MPADDPDLTALLAEATERTPLDAPGKSGAQLERVVIGGQPYVLKRLDLADDWTMRASGWLRGAPLELWRRGILARLPACFNQPIVAVGADGTTGCAVLMRDVTRWLVPATSDPIPRDQHRRFLGHMAALHARFWNGGDELDVVPAAHRYLELSPWMARVEADIGSPHLVPRLVAEGWPLLAKVAPAAAAVVVPLAHDPGPLIEALDQTPQTFVHSNWKLDNLGSDDQGRTVLLDWEQPGRGAGLSDLAWYLAINCRRLPLSKEASIAAYREALEACGIATEDWFERQLALSLLGGLVLFGWEKALGGYDDELRWWEAHAIKAAGLLGLACLFPGVHPSPHRRVQGVRVPAGVPGEPGRPVGSPAQQPLIGVVGGEVPCPPPRFQGHRGIQQIQVGGDLCQVDREAKPVPGPVPQQPGDADITRHAKRAGPCLQVDGVRHGQLAVIAQQRQAAGHQVQFQPQPPAEYQVPGQQLAGLAQV